MWDISLYSLLKQLPLKDIIRDYLEEKKKERVNKNFKIKKDEIGKLLWKLFKKVLQSSKQKSIS